MICKYVCDHFVSLELGSVLVFLCSLKHNKHEHKILASNDGDSIKDLSSSQKLWR